MNEKALEQASDENIEYYPLLFAFRVLGDAV